MAKKKDAPVNITPIVIYKCPKLNTDCITAMNELSFSPWEQDREDMYTNEGCGITVYCKACKETHELYTYSS